MPDSRLPRQVVFSQLTRGLRARGGQRKGFIDTANTTRRRVILTSTLGRIGLSTIYFGAAASTRQPPASRLTAYFTRRRSSRGERRGRCLNTCTSSFYPESPAPTPNKISKSRNGHLNDLRAHDQPLADVILVSRDR